MSGVRLDKWLWAARFFKTRSTAQQAIEGGKVKLNGESTKPAKEVRAGDALVIHIGGYEWAIRVLQLSDKRGSASVAQTLYEESEESREKRALEAVEAEPGRGDGCAARHRALARGEPGAALVRARVVGERRPELIFVHFAGDHLSYFIAWQAGAMPALG